MTRLVTEQPRNHILIPSTGKGLSSFSHHPDCFSCPLSYQRLLPWRLPGMNLKLHLHLVHKLIVNLHPSSPHMPSWHAQVHISFFYTQDACKSSDKSLCKGSDTGVRFQYKFGYVNNFNIMNSHSMLQQLLHAYRHSEGKRCIFLTSCSEYVKSSKPHLNRTHFLSFIQLFKTIRY